MSLLEFSRSLFLNWKIIKNLKEPLNYVLNKKRNKSERTFQFKKEKMVQKIFVEKIIWTQKFLLREQKGTALPSFLLMVGYVVYLTVKLNLFKLKLTKFCSRLVLMYSWKLRVPMKLSYVSKQKPFSDQR